MSESTQSQKTFPKNEDTPASPEAVPDIGLVSYKREDKGAVWTVVSLIVHGLIIGGLLLFTFTRKPIEELLARKKEHTVAKERIEKMSEHIRDANIEELQQNVMALMDIKAAMEAITDKRNKDYDPFCREQLQQKPQQALDSIKSALDNMDTSLKLQKQIADVEKAFASLPADSNTFNEEQKKIVARYNGLKGELSQPMLQMENAQEAAFFSVAWLDDQKLSELQKTAWDAQAQTRLAWDEASGDFSSMRHANGGISKYSSAVADNKKNLETSSVELNKATASRDSLKKELIVLKDGYEKSRKEYDVNKNQEAASRRKYDQLKKSKAERKDLDAANKEIQEAIKKLRDQRDIMKKAESQFNRVDKTVKNLDRNINSFTRRVNHYKSQLASSEQRLQENSNSYKEKKKSWEKNRSEALSMQQKSIDLQKQAAARLNEVIAGFDAKGGKIQLAAKLPDPLSRQEIFEIDLNELYVKADKLEELIVKEYKDLRAVELSMLRQMVLDSAKENIDTPKPLHPELKREELVGSPTTTAGLERQKEAIKIALAEGDKMQEYCQTLLDSLAVEEEISVEAEEVKEQQEEQIEQTQVQEQMTAEQQKELTEEILKQVTEQIKEVTEKTVELAKKTEIAKVVEKAEEKETKESDEKVDETVKELQEIKKELEEATDLKKVEKVPEVLEKVAKKLEEVSKQEKVAEKKSQEKKEKEKEKKEQEKLKVAEEKAREAAEAAKKAAEEIKEVAEAVKQVMQQSQQTKPMTQTAAVVMKAQLMADAASGAIAKAADVSELMKTQAKALQKVDLTTLVDRGAAHPIISNKTEGMHWGRQINSVEGGDAKWLLIDSWQSIGPWPNPNRINRERKFPPENSVDLDAVYQGVDGKPIRWEFVQPVSSRHMASVEPFIPLPYAIYYFYTEISSDTERDVWMATGSDDKSKIWINDMLVWESAPYHKNWMIGEGYRKVHLQKGINRVLYRLENGWHGTAMSLAFYMEPGF